MDETGWPLIHHGEIHRTGRGVGVERPQFVFGKGRVERADVDGMVEVDTPLAAEVVGAAEPRTGRHGRCQNLLPLREAGEHLVDHVVFVFERQQQPGEPAE